MHNLRVLECLTTNTAQSATSPYRIPISRVLQIERWRGLDCRVRAYHHGRHRPQHPSCLPDEPPALASNCVVAVPARSLSSTSPRCQVRRPKPPPGAAAQSSPRSDLELSSFGSLKTSKQLELDKAQRKRQAELEEKAEEELRLIHEQQQKVWTVKLQQRLAPLNDALERYEQEFDSLDTPLFTARVVIKNVFLQLRRDYLNHILARAEANGFLKDLPRLSAQHILQQQFSHIRQSYLAELQQRVQSLEHDLQDLLWCCHYLHHWQSVAIRIDASGQEMDQLRHQCNVLAYTVNWVQWRAALLDFECAEASAAQERIKMPNAAHHRMVNHLNSYSHHLSELPAFLPCLHGIAVQDRKQNKQLQFNSSGKTTSARHVFEHLTPLESSAAAHRSRRLFLLIRYAFRILFDKELQILAHHYRELNLVRQLWLRFPEGCPPDGRSLLSYLKNTGSLSLNSLAITLDALRDIRVYHAFLNPPASTMTLSFRPTSRALDDIDEAITANLPATSIKIDNLQKLLSDHSYDTSHPLATVSSIQYTLNTSYTHYLRLVDRLILDLNIARAESIARGSLPNWLAVGSTLVTLAESLSAETRFTWQFLVNLNFQMVGNVFKFGMSESLQILIRDSNSRFITTLRRRQSISSLAARKTSLSTPKPTDKHSLYDSSSVLSDRKDLWNVDTHVPVVYIVSAVACEQAVERLMQRPIIGMGILDDKDSSTNRATKLIAITFTTLDEVVIIENNASTPWWAIARLLEDEDILKIGQNFTALSTYLPHIDAESVYYPFSSSSPEQETSQVSTWQLKSRFTATITDHARQAVVQLATFFDSMQDRFTSGFPRDWQDEIFDSRTRLRHLTKLVPHSRPALGPIVWDGNTTATGVRSSAAALVWSDLESLASDLALRQAVTYAAQYEIDQAFKQRSRYSNNLETLQTNAARRAFAALELYTNFGFWELDTGLDKIGDLLRLREPVLAVLWANANKSEPNSPRLPNWLVDRGRVLVGSNVRRLESMSAEELVRTEERPTTRKTVMYENEMFAEKLVTPMNKRHESWPYLEIQEPSPEGQKIGILPATANTIGTSPSSSRRRSLAKSTRKRSEDLDEHMSRWDRLTEALLAVEDSTIQSHFEKRYDGRSRPTKPAVSKNETLMSRPTAGRVGMRMTNPRTNLASVRASAIGHTTSIADRNLGPRKPVVEERSVWEPLSGQHHEKEKHQAMQETERTVGRRRPIGRVRPPPTTSLSNGKGTSTMQETTQKQDSTQEQWSGFDMYD